ncbi:MAG: AAA family ATPase [Candidatus Bipolaricaulaceae bacterium]
MTRPFTVAVAGKGGTGKTTVAALAAVLLAERHMGAVLAVDADPNTNLGDALGLEVDKTIGQLREETMQRIADISPGVTKDRLLEYGLHQCLVEGEGIDLLAMGRGEGPRCYCMVNHVLRKYIQALGDNYRYLVLDNEAGMEHLSRRTTQDVDALLVVSGPDPISLRAAERIAALVDDLGLRVGGRWLVVNGRRPPAPPIASRPGGLQLAGEVPYDEEVYQLALAGRPLTELPGESPARRAMGEILTRL